MKLLSTGALKKIIAAFSHHNSITVDFVGFKFMMGLVL